MAIIQISKMQQRSGNLVDLPQLDEGELGWASDQGLLYIGKNATGSNIENVEVLTSYSNISFNQIDGASGNLNITASSLEEGQILAYDSITDNWVNRGGSGISAGGLINLGSVSNVKIDGGGIGYVLSTDGIGNLSWTPKGTLYTTITDLTNDPSGNVITMTVANTTPYTNQQSITITSADISNSGANSNINGHTFYIKLAGDFATSGNVTLYTDLGLTSTANGAGLSSYTSNSGIATAVISAGGGGGNAGGATNSIQFNNNGISDGSANLTFDYATKLMNLNGNANVANLNANGVIKSPTFTSTITTGTAPLIVTSTTRVANLNVATSGVANTVNDNAQPNITSVGTLVSLSISGNANIGNIGTGGLITAVGNIRGANLITSGLLSVTGNANIGNVGATLFVGNLSGTGNSNVGNLGTTGVFATTLSSTGNANVGNIGGTTGVFTTISGTLSTAGQTNITAVGTLTTLSVSGNANVGNIGAALHVGNLSGTGNSNIGNLGVTGLITVTGNITTSANLTGTHYGSATGLTSIPAGNLTGTIPSGVLGSSTLYVGTTAIALNRGSASQSLTGITSIDGYSSTVSTAAQPNITSVSSSFTNLTFANAQTLSGNNMTLTTGANTNTGTITGNWSLSAGSKLQSTYADLAEYYEADTVYEPGTVLEFGGNKEVTLASDGTTRVAGVVSSNPAYVMNSGCSGYAIPIALQGRVPVKVRGKVSKGDMMVSGGSGYARPTNNPQLGTIIGKALANFDGVDGIIEIAVGRL